jgi:hypothetical protein
MDKLPKLPSNPYGRVPSSDFTEPFGLKVGLITRVDEYSMKADVKVLTGGGDRFEIDLTQSLAGPRSFWGGIPEENSLVILGYRKKAKRIFEAMILGYIPVGARSGLRFDPFSPTSPAEVTAEDAQAVRATIGNTTRYKRLFLRPGDCGGMSSRGAEVAFTQDVRMLNRAGDLFELRDSDRTLIMQSIHRVESASGVRSVIGPIRRGDFWLPPDIFKADGKTLRDPTTLYYGRDELQASGPDNSRFADSSGKMLDVFNDATEQPAITYSNGRRVHCPATTAAASFETEEGAGARVYVEQRTELSHTSDLTQEVLGEIDGYSADRFEPFIEHVMGTIVGNGTMSSMGQRQYGRILMPVLFDGFEQTTPGTFRLEEVNRAPTAPDLEVDTTAGAFLLRIRPPRKVDENVFGVAVQKQGKVLINLPGSIVERAASGSRNISAEINTAGAIKMVLGAQVPNNVSLHVVGTGGVVMQLGADSEGNSLTILHSGAIKFKHVGGTANDSDVAISEEIDGNKESTINGTLAENIEGTRTSVVSGQHQLKADRVTIQGFSGYTLNAGELNQMISGKSQYNYALAVVENIILGGRLTTVFAGGVIENIIAGGATKTVLGGAMATTVAAGAYTVQVGAGAISITTGAGVIAISTGLGAISIAATTAIAITGLAVTINAGAMVAINSPQVLLGAAVAPWGVARGLPMMAPALPSLCWITGAPLMGSLMVRSI